MGSASLPARWPSGWIERDDVSISELSPKIIIKSMLANCSSDLIEPHLIYVGNLEAPVDFACQLAL